MMKMLLFSCMLFICERGFTQTATFDSSGVLIGKPDIMPAHKGGVVAWMKFLQRHLNSLFLEKNNAPEGPYTVAVSFIIDEKGNLSDFKPVKDPGFGTIDEAVKLIKAGPGYVPALVNGKPVRYRYTESFSFEMASS